MSEPQPPAPLDRPAPAPRVSSTTRARRPSAAHLAPALALLCAFPLSAQHRATTPAPFPLPHGTFAWIATADGDRVVGELDEWISALRLAPGTKLRLAALRLFVWRATGARSLEELAERFVPGRTVLGLTTQADGPRPVPFVLAEGHTRVPDLLRDRPDLRAGIVDGRLLLAPRAGYETVHDRLVGTASTGRAPADDRADPGPVLARGAADLHGYLDVAALRARLGEGDRPGPAGFFVLAPWLEAWRTATALTAELDIADTTVRLEASVDGGPAPGGPAARLLATDERGDDAVGMPPPTAASPQSSDPALATVASLRLARSPFTLFAARDELLLQGEAAQIGGGLSIADSLTGGSFLDDLLANIDEPWTLHVLPALRPEQELIDEELLAGPLALPCFLLTAPLVPGTDEDEVRGLAHNTLAKFAFAAEAERRRNGEIAFHARQHSTDAGTPIVVARPEPWRGPPPAPVEATLSPSLAVHRGHVLLASTEYAVLRGMAALDAAEGGRHERSGREDGSGPGHGHRDGAARHAGTQSPATATADGVADCPYADCLYIDGPRLAELGRRNHRLLEFDRIVEEGMTPSAAHRRITTILDVVGALRALRLETTFSHERTTATMTLEGTR